MEMSGFISRIRLPLRKVHPGNTDLRRPLEAFLAEAVEISHQPSIANRPREKTIEIVALPLQHCSRRTQRAGASLWRVAAALTGKKGTVLKLCVSHCCRVHPFSLASSSPRLAARQTADSDNPRFFATTEPGMPISRVAQ